ncbi:hypothetical protein H2200_002432 [Cladophialophora chaetospira]|uniref:Uncharacterized protein n=1 Tax=Cladophialophora chaetospira TaxID=386627 RepID=A0AA38XIY9_9EURO|nr:hypothetical protein H2200_002432 [Cladophialophora chaetospira]
MSTYQYSDIIFEIKGKIGVIKFNRAESLNSFGGRLIIDTIHALRVLNSHSDTVFTVITGAGRFFSSGADVQAMSNQVESSYTSLAEKKLEILNGMSGNIQLVRSLIDHRKVLVLAMNGPAVGGGAAWFQGVADLVLASTKCWLQCPFSALGLVPEFGSAGNFPQNIGVHRTNEILMLGCKVTAEELLRWGMVNRVFKHEGFHNKVIRFLEEQLVVNDGQSMLEAKRLMNAPLRDKRLHSLYEAVDAVAERFVEDAPVQRFAAKSRLLKGQCSLCILLKLRIAHAELRKVEQKLQNLKIQQRDRVEIVYGLFELALS